MQTGKHTDDRQGSTLGQADRQAGRQKGRRALGRQTRRHRD